MKPNMGTVDKSVRIATAVAIAILYFTNIISGTLAIILFILAVFLSLPVLSVSALFIILWAYQQRTKLFNHKKNKINYGTRNRSTMDG